MNELALFAGVGGGLLATHHLLGWRAVGYVEMAEYPCKALEARIKDGLLSPAPIFQMHTRDFIRLGIAEKYRGVADVITAGFPCQPFSGAGNLLGEQDERNGWPDTIDIIRLVQPKYVLLENVPRLLTFDYFGTILGDLAEAGYDATWDVLSACAFGAPHTRERLFIMAYSDSERGWRGGQREDGATRLGQAKARQEQQKNPIKAAGPCQVKDWYAAEPPILGMANGVAHRMGRLKATGNGQVPTVVKEFWRLTTQ